MKIYFHCQPQGDHRYPAFQHQLINLAFGLKVLGIEYFSNLTYWKIGKEDYLFNKSAVAIDDCDVLITSHGEFEYNWELPNAFFKKDRSYRTVYIDTADGLFTRAYTEKLQHFDLILKQKSKGMWYPKNCKHSWAFGLSPYMVLKEVPDLNFEDRKNEILANYRHVHTFRKQGEVIISKLKNLVINKKSEPLDYSSKSKTLANEDDFYKLGYLQSGGRFHPNYIKRLRTSMACACFGGNLLPSKWFVSSPQLFKIANYIYDNTNQGRLIALFRKLNLQIKHQYGIYQWDSWRLWETFEAGSLVINIDFEKYGVDMPIMPVNFKHYIGIDLLNPEESINKINAMSITELETIALNGKKWAEAHYAPKAIAQRFLDIIQ
jgi:hypothetical protein